MQAQRLWLAEGVEDTLRRAARAAYPREACGLLLGRRRGTLARVARATVARNLAGKPDRFEVHPEDHLAAELAARAAGLELVGVWHSHPDRAPRPSRRDAAAALAGWSYAIVSVEDGRDAALASFFFDGACFAAESLSARGEAQRA